MDSEDSETDPELPELVWGSSDDENDGAHTDTQSEVDLPPDIDECEDVGGCFSNDLRANATKCAT